MTASQTLAGFCTELDFGTIPREAAHAAKRHALDALGVALAAAGSGVASPVVESVLAWAGAREASVIGYDFGAPAPHAALANGTLVHALDFDDTHPESIVHPASFVVPAALAVAEESEANGREFLTACVAGYETSTRIGAAAPGRFQARGLHTTGIAGTFGAAVAAGVLWGLTSEELANALGIAGSQSSGLIAFLADGSETKRFHPGWAAQGGVVAADLARRGLTGPSTVFEGPHGLFDALLSGEERDTARIVRGLGTEWETMRLAIKAYPACQYVHAFMDAAIGLGVRAGDVEEITCEISPAGIDIVCEPRAGRLNPASMYAAQFSLPFSVASAVVGGRAGVDLFGEDARSDKRVLGLAERVRHVADDSLPRFGGRVTIVLRDGRVREAEELVVRGHPDRPLTDDEVTEKFLSNARRRLENGAAQKAADVVWKLDEIDSIAELASLVQVS